MVPRPVMAPAPIRAVTTQKRVSSRSMSVAARSSDSDQHVLHGLAGAALHDPDIDIAVAQAGLAGLDAVRTGKTYGDLGPLGELGVHHHVDADDHRHHGNDQMALKRRDELISGLSSLICLFLLVPDHLGSKLSAARMVTITTRQSDCRQAGRITSRPVGCTSATRMDTTNTSTMDHLPMSSGGPIHHRALARIAGPAAAHSSTGKTAPAVCPGHHHAGDKMTAAIGTRAHIDQQYDPPRMVLGSALPS